MNADFSSLPVTLVRHDLVFPVLALLLASSPGAAADRNRVLARILSAAVTQAQPTVTVLPSASGAALQSYAGGSTVLSLGRAAYYGGAPAAGVSARKGGSSMILSTRFALQVDCGGNSPSSPAEITASLAGLNPSYTVTMDGAPLSSVASPITLQCGSRTEHVIEIEIPKDKPAGPIASTISFAATAKY